MSEGSEHQVVAGKRIQEGWHHQVTSFLASLQFLTLAPPIVKRAFTAAELGGAVGYFPVTGLLLGLVLVGLDRVSRMLLPVGVTTVLLLIAWEAITGALHLDGFLDTCDGLLGGHSPEQRLEIMRDHRIGAFALAGGVLLLLLKYSALGALAQRSSALLIAPLLGRWALSLAIIAFPYARPQGVGRMLKDNARGIHLVLASAAAVAAVVLIGSWRGLIALGLTGLGVWVGARFALRRIPGLTGDVYGAICQIVETIVLVAFVVLEKGS